MDVFYREYLAQKNHLINDRVVERALESLEGAALRFSSECISDAAQRDNYNRNVSRIKTEVLAQISAGKVQVRAAAEFCYEVRNKVMAETRKRTSVPGRAVAERRSVSPRLEELLDEQSIARFGKAFSMLEVERRNSMYYELVEFSVRQYARFNALNKVLRVSGKVLIVVTIAYAAYDIANAENKTKEPVKQGVTISGGAAGTALAGLTVSTFCDPGAPFCAIGLMLAAGLTSGWVDSKLAGSIDDEIEEFTRWNIS